MRGIKLKIALILLMLVPMPFSCVDKNECLDLYVEPYFDIREMDFRYVDMYHEYYVKGKKYLMFDAISQDFSSQVYPCDSMAMYFEATLLSYHAQNIKSPKFGFTQEVFACNSKRAGWAGTRELVDKIYISSNYDFDETHGKNYDLSDIIDIFAYTTTVDDKAGDSQKGGWMLLSDYNKNSPYEAPKRFYLLIKRKPTLSKTQQFVIKYYMKTEPGEAPKYFIITTPVFKVR